MKLRKMARKIKVTTNLPKMTPKQFETLAKNTGEVLADLMTYNKTKAVTVIENDNSIDNRYVPSKLN